MGPAELAALGLLEPSWLALGREQDWAEEEEEEGSAVGEAVAKVVCQPMEPEDHQPFQF